MFEITRRQILLILVGVLAVTTMVVGIYGLVREPASESPTNGTFPPVVATSIEVTPRQTAVEVRSLPHTSNPNDYARAVATSLFDWDTTTGLLPTDYTAAVLADADPSGEETPGLITDVATYLPTVDQWLDLATMEVTQSLSIEGAAIPESWSSALEQARGELRPGTTAVTITGTRHREGTWDGARAETSYPVAFTVFVACPPAFERCHVLRLSQLDNPLR